MKYHFVNLRLIHEDPHILHYDKTAKHAQKPILNYICGKMVYFPPSCRIHLETESF